MGLPPYLPVGSGPPAGCGRTLRVPARASAQSQIAYMQAKTPPALGFSTDRVLDWSEISQHRSRESAWMVLRNKVFDITDYLSLHPGGSDILLRFCGQDATTQFNAAHPWVHFESIIGHRQVGVLPTSEH